MNRSNEMNPHIDNFYEECRERRCYFRDPQDEKEIIFQSYVIANPCIKPSDYEFIWEIILMGADDFFTEFNDIMLSEQWRERKPKTLESYRYLRNEYLKLKAI